MRVYEKVRMYIVDNGYKQVVVAKKAGIPKATFVSIKPDIFRSQLLVQFMIFSTSFFRIN